MTREEALKILKDCRRRGFEHTLYYIDEYHTAMDMAIEALEKEPKTWHWRAVYQGDEIIDYRCTECEFGNTFGKSTYRMNYCPNCGAKMVEPQESEEKE